MKDTKTKIHIKTHETNWYMGKGRSTFRLIAMTGARKEGSYLQLYPSHQTVSHPERNTSLNSSLHTDKHSHQHFKSLSPPER